MNKKYLVPAQCKQQKGVVLILFVFFLALVATSYQLKLINSKQHEATQYQVTGMALDEAKRAIVGWSVMNNIPGRLPCPENTALIGLSTEGQALASCALPAIGRLPWKSLGLGDLRDGNGDRLWYVISNGFRVSPINLNTQAQLTLNGVPNAAVAIVFSPGKPLSGQSRNNVSAANPPNISDYLDLENQDGDADFSTLGNVNIFNDRLLSISSSELFTAVNQRILGEVRGDASQGMVKFFIDNANYPFADSDADGVADTGVYSGSPSFQGGAGDLFFASATKSMLQNNGWMPLIQYTVNTTQQSASITLGTRQISVP